MVKRWEKKGRKPILQLEDSTKNSPLPASSSSSGASTSGLRGLIQYDDSDNENGIEDSESCVTSAGETKKIDLEVADFLKEIDALTEVQDTSEAEAKEGEDEKEEPATELENNLNSTDQTQNNGISADISGQAFNIADAGHSSAWQQCYDEGSGYTYFWNIETNQVTWECPEEVMEASKSSQSSVPNHSMDVSSEAGPSTHPGNGCRHLPPKKQPHRTKTKVEVGKIIPISYFDQSTTSESSDDEKNCSEPSQKKRKLSPELPLFGPDLPHVPNTNLPDAGIQSANGSLASDDTVTSPSYSQAEVFYGPQLPEINELNSSHLQRSSECDILVPSSSDQLDRTLTNGVSSPLDLSHPLERDSCDQSNVCESSDSVRESPHLDVALTVDNVAEACSSPLIQVRNISESVELGVDSVEVCEVEPSTSGLNYESVSVSYSEEPDSTCTSRKVTSVANQALGREATSVPQGLKNILQYEESESEPEPEAVSASPSAQPSPPVWSLYEAKSSTSIDIISTPEAKDNRKTTSSSKSDTMQSHSSSSTLEEPVLTSSTLFESPMSASISEEPGTSSSQPTVVCQSQPCSSVPEEPRQPSTSTSTTDEPQQFASRPSTFLPHGRSTTIISQHVFDPGEPGNENRQSSSFPPTARRSADTRHGFGFNNLEPVEPEAGQSTSSGRSSISFVRSNEVFNLNQINEELEAKSKVLANLKPTEANSSLPTSQGERIGASIPSSAVQEELDEEIDFDDIEKELDKALERKKNAVNRLEMPSTSRQADLLNRSAGPSYVPESDTTRTPERESLEALSSDLLVKLKLLNAERSHLPLLTLLLIMLETRHTDWQRGALSSQYFAARLQESSGVLRQYELNSTPPGWACAWDRHLKKYFYIHEASGVQQFDFPTVTEEEFPSAEGELASTSSMDLSASVLVGHNNSSAGQNPMVTSSTAEEFFRSAARSSLSINEVRRVSQVLSRQTPSSVPPEPPPPLPVAPPLPPSPPPPPCTPPPALPKSPPPPPDSTELKEDDDLATVMDVEDSNSKESSSDANPSSSSSSLGLAARPVLKNVQTSPVESAPMPSCLEQEQVAFYESLGNSCSVQTTSSNAGLVISSGAIISKPPQTLPAIAASTTAVSTSDVPPPSLQDSNYINSTPATWIQPPTVFFPVTEPDAVCVDESRDSVATNVAGPSGLSFPTVSLNSEASSSMASVAGPSGLCGVETLSSVPGPSGLSASGSSASSAAGFSGLSDSVVAVAGPSHGAGDCSSLNSTGTKKDKKKTKLSSGLSLKKKNISSLVQKWQKIKKEQLLEEGLAQNERRPTDRDDKKNSDQDGKISTTM